MLDDVGFSMVVSNIEKLPFIMQQIRVPAEITWDSRWSKDVLRFHQTFEGPERLDEQIWIDR